MINSSRIDNIYKQSGRTCVLSSYAIVSHYFTRRLIQDIFSDYCKHFNLIDKTSLSVRYDKHFHEYIRKNNMSGYDCINSIHFNSDLKTFVQGRDQFSIIPYKDTMANIDIIEPVLINDEALINISYYTGHGFHSVTVYCDEKDRCFKLRDTEKVKIDISTNSLSEMIGILTENDGSFVADCNLYTRINNLNSL